MLQGLFGKGESNWRVAKGGDDKWEKKRAVLARYRELHGDMKVPEGYIIPSIPDWPKVLLDRNAFNTLPRDTHYRRLTSRCPPPPIPVVVVDASQDMHGIKLGKMVSNIRSGLSFTDKRAELEAMGIEYRDSPRELTFPVVKAALIRYKQIFTNFNVAPKFTIPKSSSLWPPEMASMRLGEVVMRFRSGEWVTTPEETQFFADIGIVPGEFPPGSAARPKGQPVGAPWGSSSSSGAAAGKDLSASWGVSSAAYV